MSETLTVCDVDNSLVKKLKEFRFRKNCTNGAIVMKVDKDTRQVIVEKEFEEITLDDLQEELPDRQPRYIVYSYKYVHDDQRVSYPLCFIFSSPAGCPPELQMMYAGSKLALQKAIGVTKVFEIRNVEEMTEDWLKERLGFFR